MESKVFILIRLEQSSCWRAVLLMLASSHPESIFTPDRLALCKYTPLNRSAEGLSHCLVEKQINDGFMFKSVQF